eukprot:SAG11_NODE_318_length_10823_cov_79.807068_8_plen_85_part_00
MPNVNGMKFPYTAAGMKAAKKAKGAMTNQDMSRMRAAVGSGVMTDQDMSRMINQAQQQQEQSYKGQSSDLDKFINTRGRHSGRG